MMHEERKWFVGIDWASQEHVVTLCDGQGKKIGERKFAHGGTGLSDMISWLLRASGDRFTVAGAKDDSLDAYVLADSLRTDMQLFRKLTITEPLIVEVREWSRIDEELKVERVRLTNRLRDQLWRY